MRKLIAILILLVGTFSLKAQSMFGHTTFNPLGTVTNTGVDTMTYTTTQAYSVITIQPTMTKTSGTIAGTMVLYSKNSSGASWVATGDTLTLGNSAINSTMYNKPSAARYWMIKTTGSGTMVGVTSATINGNQQ